MYVDVGTVVPMRSDHKVKDFLYITIKTVSHMAVSVCPFTTVLCFIVYIFYRSCYLYGRF